jgi:chloramphenicol O-acetyltransferase type A
MQEIDVNEWERKATYDFFKECEDPFFSISTKVNVDKAYARSKQKGESFYLIYLHAALKALNEIEAFKYRLVDDKVFMVDAINVSCTVARDDNSFGIARFPYAISFDEFKLVATKAMDLVKNEKSIQADSNTLDVVYTSVTPWFSFTEIKNPRYRIKEDSIPKLVFGRFEETSRGKEMNFTIDAHHGFADAYHVGEFLNRFQSYLDKE